MHQPSFVFRPIRAIHELDATTIHNVVWRPFEPDGPTIHVVRALPESYERFMLEHWDRLMRVSPAVSSLDPHHLLLQRLQRRLTA
jgi:hypothetical protein